MNKKFNEWYIDMSLCPKDGQLEKRIHTINSNASKMSRDQIITLVRLYFGMPVAESERESIANLFIADDSSFSIRYTEELALLSGALLVEIAESVSRFDSLAELLTIATSFVQKPAATVGILAAIKEQFDIDRINIREEHSKPTIREDTYSKMVSNLKTHIEENDWDSEAPNKLLEIFNDLSETLAGLDERIDAMEQSQSVYHEDSQVLWWMLSKWSEISNCSLNNIDKRSGCLLIGWEAANIIEIFPGPYSMEGIIENLLNTCKGKVTKGKFAEIITGTSKILTDIVTQKLAHSKLVDMLPLCKAIISSTNTEKLEEWYPKYKKENVGSVDISQLTLFQYSWQMYIERMITRCYDALET